MDSLLGFIDLHSGLYKDVLPGDVEAGRKEGTMNRLGARREPLHKADYNLATRAQGLTCCTRMG